LQEIQARQESLVIFVRWRVSHICTKGKVVHLYLLLQARHIDRSRAMREAARMWLYIFAVEKGEGRELTEQEDQVVNRFRFGGQELRLVRRPAPPTGEVVLTNNRIYSKRSCHGYVLLL
jgi:hypothetical protein